MKKGSSKSKQNPEPQTPRRRKYDEEFKRQAVAMVRNGQPVRSVAQALGGSRLQSELHLIIGRLEDFTTRVKDGLDQADWNS